LVNYVHKSFLTAVLILCTSQVERFCGENSDCATVKQNYDSVYYNGCTAAVCSFTLRE